MPLLPEEQGEILEVPDQRETEAYLCSHAKALLKSNGHNVARVTHVYSAFNSWWPGYEMILYTSYGAVKRTAYIWYENGTLKIKTASNWFEQAVGPPENSRPDGQAVT